MSRYVLIRNGMEFDPLTGIGGGREEGLLALGNDMIDGSGVVDLNGGDLLVAQQASPDMTVKMAKGRLWIKNDSWVQNTYDTTKFYPCLVDAIQTPINIGSNSSGSTRYDLICLKINTAIDPGDSGEFAVTVEVVVGTPGGGVPATPANHYKVAEIQVINGATSIPTAKITDTRNGLSVGGRLVANLTAKATPVDADMIQLMDSVAANVFKKLSWANLKASLAASYITQDSIFRQAIINGNFDIWGRGISVVDNGTKLTSFLADRWYFARTGYAAGMQMSQQDGTGVPGSVYCLRVQRKSGNTSTNGINGGYAIPTRDTVKLRGQKMTLSFWARKGANFSSASNNLNYGLTERTAVDEALETYGGMDTSAIAVLTSSWQYFTITLPAVIQATTNTFKVLFGFSPVGTASTNDYFEIAQVQLCAGEVALPFMPKSFNDEQRDCFPFFQKSYNYADPPQTNEFKGLFTGVSRALDATNMYNVLVPFKTRMRKAPTVTTYRRDGSGSNPAYWRLNQGTYYDAGVLEISETGFYVVLSGLSGLTAGQALNIDGHFVADAEL